MIRPVATALVLFFIPFALYAAYLWATRNGILDVSSWRPQVVAWLTIGALCLVIAGLFLTAEFSGAPPHSAYVPAHMENGRLVPGVQR
jgi:hypothetical protein